MDAVSTLSSLLSLAALILCAYGFLSAERSGRFARSVRVGSALGFAVTCILLWYFGRDLTG